MSRALLILGPPPTQLTTTVTDALEEAAMQVGKADTLIVCERVGDVNDKLGDVGSVVTAIIVYPQGKTILDVVDISPYVLGDPTAVPTIHFDEGIHF